MRAMGIVVFVSACVAVVASCAVQIPDGRFACNAEVACPPGFACVDGLCRLGAGDASGDLGFDVAVDTSDSDGMMSDVVRDSGVESATDTAPTDTRATDAPPDVPPDVDSATPSDAADVVPDAAVDAPSCDPAACPWAACVGSVCDRPVQVSTGSDTTCVVTTVGYVWCWGYNGNGQLGIGTSGEHDLRPRLVPGIHDAIEVRAASNATCVRRAGGVIDCAGDGSNGQLALGADMSAVHPTFAAAMIPAPRHATSLAGVNLTFCAAMDDMSVYCWGNGGLGSTGDGDVSTHTVSLPVRVQLDGDAGVLTGAVQIASMNYANCARASSGNVFCWGGNSLTYLGTPGIMPSAAVQVAGVSGVGDIEGSGYRAFVTESGAVTSWGAGHPALPLSTPAPTAAATAPGDTHVCLISSDAHVYCTGDNSHGQVGNGTESATPATAWNDVGLVHAASIASAHDHTCAITTGGDLLCWGRNDAGQIGNGSMTDATTPTIITP
jgi:hypothetical protein